MNLPELTDQSQTECLEVERFSKGFDKENERGGNESRPNRFLRLKVIATLCARSCDRNSDKVPLLLIRIWSESGTHRARITVICQGVFQNDTKRRATSLFVETMREEKNRIARIYGTRRFRASPQWRRRSSRQIRQWI